MKRLGIKTNEQTVGITTIQMKRKEKAKDPEADTTSRLTVPGLHSHPSTPKSRPKRCVETPGDPWDVSQPPGSFYLAYGAPPTAKRWYLHLALPRGDNHCQFSDVPNGN